MKTNLLRTILLLTSFALTASLHAEPTLFGNKALAGQSLDADGIKAVLLGKKSPSVTPASSSSSLKKAPLKTRFSSLTSA